MGPSPAYAGAPRNNKGRTPPCVCATDIDLHRVYVTELFSHRSPSARGPAPQTPDHASRSRARGERTTGRATSRGPSHLDAAQSCGSLSLSQRGSAEGLEAGDSTEPLKTAPVCPDFGRGRRARRTSTAPAGTGCPCPKEQRVLYES